MGKILYSAIDNQGNKTYGYCKGATNKEVLFLLRNQELTDIKLYADAFNSPDREDLDSLDKSQESKIAKHDIDMFMNPTFKRHLLFAMRDNKKLGTILFGLALFLYGIYDKSTLIILLGLIVLLIIPILQWATYLFVSNFAKLHKSFAYGKWAEVQKRLDDYKNYDQALFPTSVKVELDKMDAILLAIKNNPNEALEIVQKKYSFLENISSYAYDSLILAVYRINGDYDDYLKQMRKIYESNPEISIHILDMAMAEAYFGDKKNAKSLLKKLIIEELPIFAIPMIDTINGVIIKEENNYKALKYLKKSAKGMQGYKTNPFYLIPLSITIGYYSLAAYDDGQEEHAINILENVWDVLKIHGHKTLLENIVIRMPQYQGSMY